MSDGKLFDQAVRALDRFIAEQRVADEQAAEPTDADTTAPQPART